MPRISIVLLFILNSFVTVSLAQNQKNESKLTIQEQIVSNLIDSSVSFRDRSYDLSVEVCEKAIRLAEARDIEHLLAKALKTQGVNYYYLRENDSCLYYYKKAIAKFKELDNQIQVGKILGNIGVVYKRKVDYSKAVEYYLKELEVFEKISYWEGLAAIYTNLGGLSFLMENHKRAEDYYKQALDIAVKTHSKVDRLNALNNLGVLYEGQNKLKEALEVYKESLSIVRNTGNSMMESKLYLNMGIIYRRNNDLDKASDYFEKSFNIRKLIGDYADLLGVYNEMFELALARNKYREAKQLAGVMHDLALINSDAEWFADVYRAYSDLYRATGDYKLALEAYEKHRSIGDSLQTVQNEERYSELMVKYDTDHSKQKMELMTQHSTIQKLELDKKNAWLVAMLIIMLLGVIAIVVSFRINSLKAQHKLMSLNQKVLLSQMNPHFLFNALTAVQSLVLDNKGDEANMYLCELAGLVRNILEDSRKEYISLRKELDILEKYIDLQKLRFDFVINYCFEIDGKIDLDEIQIPPMLTQPFIENALIHANLKNVQNPEILIKLNLVEDKYVEFSIQDNGIGIEAGKKQSLMKENKSLATQIANDRVQIYNYKSKIKMKLDIIDIKYIDPNKQGTLARFIIPLQV